MYKHVVGTIALSIVIAVVAGDTAGSQVNPSLPSGISELAPSPPSGPQPDDAAVARGTRVYEVTGGCAPCHGLTGRGGPGNAPDLTRSAIAMRPDDGRSLAMFVRVGRPDKGMPAAPGLTDQDAADLSAKLRSLGFSAAPSAQPLGRGGGRGRTGPALPAALAGQELSIVVGDPQLGKRFFDGSVGKCASCHAVRDGESSSAANLAHIAAKYPDPKLLQNAMLINRALNWSPRTNRDVTATVTYSTGRVVKGYLTSVSDFKVIIRDDQNTETEISRKDGEPTVVLTDRLQHHLDLLATYMDNDIHNLTAYLVTLK
jgi:cytochrome c oxidase cbb3-type subunit 3